MEGVPLERFKKLKPSTIPMAQFNQHLSGESDQNASTTATHLCIILQLIISKDFIDSLLKTICDHTDGFVKQYGL